MKTGIDKKKYVAVNYSNIRYSTNSIVAHRTNNNMKNVLGKNPKISKLRESGVYKIGCHDCECFTSDKRAELLWSAFQEHLP